MGFPDSAGARGAAVAAGAAAQVPQLLAAAGRAPGRAAGAAPALVLHRVIAPGSAGPGQPPEP